MRTMIRPMEIVSIVLLGLLIGVGFVLRPTPQGASAVPAAEPETIQVTGTVRDFKESGASGGHPDFEIEPVGGFGHFMGAVSPTLGDDGKPQLGGLGFKVDSPWRDAQGRDICHLLYDAGLGDAAGVMGAASTGGIDSPESLSTWFRDDPGTNMSMPLTLTFVRQDDGSYLFDDKADPLYSSLGGFFPIDDRLFGNPGGSPDHNYHFTFEIHAGFTYQAGSGQVFRFIGDDDVWVYIDGNLVIDIAGIHSEIEQFVELDRLGLTDGEHFSLDFFFAERHRTKSNFRIVTNLLLETTPTEYTISAPYD